MSETQMWVYLRNRIPRGVFAQRITDRLSTGVPDVYWAASPKETGWFEMKFAHSFGGSKLDLRADQASWLVEHPGRSGVVVLVKGKGIPRWVWIPSERTVAWAEAIQGLRWDEASHRMEVWYQPMFTVEKLIDAMLRSTD